MFQCQFFEAEHVLDVLKIEHDIMDVIPFKSEYLPIVWSKYVVSPSLHTLLYQLYIICM